MMSSESLVRVTLYAALPLTAMYLFAPVGVFFALPWGAEMAVVAVLLGIGLLVRCARLAAAADVHTLKESLFVTALMIVASSVVSSLRLRIVELAEAEDTRPLADMFISFVLGSTFLVFAYVFASVVLDEPDCEHCDKRHDLAEKRSFRV